MRPKIEAIAKQFPGAKVNDVSGLKAQFETQIDQILGLVFALLFLAIFIALLGIMNTLLLSIVERTREIGLPARGRDARKQVRTSVRWESIIVAVFGALLGLVLGVFFGWAMVTALHDQGFTQLSRPGDPTPVRGGARRSRRGRRRRLPGPPRLALRRPRGHLRRVTRPALVSHPRGCIRAPACVSVQSVGIRRPGRCRGARARR